MSATSATYRKRPVNLTLNESLVAQARNYTSNLSATLEVLLTDYVQRQEQARHMRQQAADDWNTLHTRVGSYADEHTTL